MNRTHLAAAVGMILVSVATPAPAEPLSREDERAVRRNLYAYRDGWMEGDAAAIMATLTDDATLIPSGLDPVSGAEAIRAFWWPPDSPPLTIEAMDLHVDRIEGASGTAWVWGKGSLTFSWMEDGAEKKVTSRSTFLNILRRQEDGSWKTALRMWSDRSRP